MDMRYEATSMDARAEIAPVVVKSQDALPQVMLALSSQVASFSCPSIAGTSISAVSPDNIYFGGTALAAA